MKPYDNPFWGFEQWYQEINNNNKKRKFPLAPMGVLAPGSAQARPSAWPPIDTSGNFPAHVSAESPSNISPNPSEVISEVSEPYDNFWNFQKETLKKPKNAPPGGQGGSPNFGGGLVSPFFVRINPLWSFRTLTDHLLKFSKKDLKQEGFLRCQTPTSTVSWRMQS